MDTCATCDEMRKFGHFDTNDTKCVECDNSINWCACDDPRNVDNSCEMDMSNVMDIRANDDILDDWFKMHARDKMDIMDANAIYDMMDILV